MANSLKIKPIKIRGLVKVLPYLYLGDAAASREEVELKRQGITEIINCVAEEIENEFPQGFNYTDIPLEDELSINISQYFDKVYDVIKAAKDSYKKILVHCTNGKNISVSFIIAYILMASEKQGKQATLAAVYKFVGNKEPGIQPSDELLSQLIELEKDLFDGQQTMRVAPLQAKKSNRRRGKGRGVKGKRGK